MSPLIMNHCIDNNSTYSIDRCIRQMSCHIWARKTKKNLGMRHSPSPIGDPSPNSLPRRLQCVDSSTPYFVFYNWITGLTSHLTLVGCISNSFFLWRRPLLPVARGVLNDGTASSGWGAGWSGIDRRWSAVPGVAGAPGVTIRRQLRGGNWGTEDDSITDMALVSNNCGCCQETFVHWS